MTPFYNEPDRDSAIDTLRRAREIGVNFLDSSDAYGQGRNEELIVILTKRLHPPPCQGATAAQISAGPVPLRIPFLRTWRRRRVFSGWCGVLSKPTRYNPNWFELHSDHLSFCPLAFGFAGRQQHDKR
jgi:hypothetical protein